MYAEKDNVLTNLEIIPIKPYKNIRIGDRLYFEHMEAGVASKGEKSLVFDEKMTCCQHGALLIGNVSEKYESEYNPGQVIDLNTIYACIALAGQSQKDRALNQLEVYFTNMVFLNQTKVQKTLGCDTASFEIEVDGKYDEIRTGSDGYYGTAYKFKQYYGSYIELSFDGDLFTYDEVKDIMLSLFEEDKSMFFNNNDINCLKSKVMEDFENQEGKVSIPNEQTSEYSPSIDEQENSLEL